jgi:hypothetical protein
MGNIDEGANERLKAENLFTVPDLVAVITGGGSGMSNPPDHPHAPSCTISQPLHPIPHSH